MLEWRRTGLYQHSIHSKMAVAISARVVQILESRSSSCIVPQNDSTRVVVAVADRAHGRYESSVDHAPSEAPGGELTAVVGM